MTLPEGLLAHLQDAGEDVQCVVQTAGQRAWVGPQGEEITSSIWAVATLNRMWLIAEDATGPWALATGRLDDVSLQAGWLSDTLHVGEHRMQVPRRRRSDAQAVLEAFQSRGGGGTAVAPRVPTPPPGRAPAAKGARDVPAWLPLTVPATSSEHWLSAWRTPQSRPLPLPDGTIARPSMWIAVTERRTVLAAHIDELPTWFAVVSNPLYRDGTLQVGPLRIELPRKSARVADLVLARTPRERWALAAELAVDAGRGRDGLRLMAEAHGLDVQAGWSVMARILWAVEHPLLAVGAAIRALEVEGLELDAAAEVQRFARQDARRLRREGVDAALVRGLMRAPLDALTLPTPPDGLPWPPQSGAEVWAAALALCGQHARAIALWEDAPMGPRRRRAIATLLEDDHHAGAADAWQLAAFDHRPKEPAEAAAAMDRAIALDPTPARLWVRAAWAHLDGEAELAETHWAAALAVDADEAHRTAIPTDGDLALAAVAEREEAYDAAARAYTRVLQAEPKHVYALEALATVLATRLDRAAEAADRLEERLALSVDGDDAAWPLRVRQARYALQADDRDRALQALQAAVQNDFLHPEAWRAASAVAADAGVASPWWAHVRGVLEGTPAGAPRLPAERLDPDTMDALHPGGVGWMEQMRTLLTHPDPPDRRSLVRGLGQLTEAEHGDLVACVKALCQRLDLDVPDVYLFRGEGAYGVSAWATSPPVVLVGHEHLVDGARQLSLDALSYLIAVELVHLKCNHPVLTFDTDLVGTSRSMYRAFGSFAGTAEGVVDVVSLIPGVDQIARLQRMILLSRRVFATRSALDKVADVATPVLKWLGISDDAPKTSVGRQGSAGAALAFRMQADRAALLLTGNLELAVRAILKASADALDLATSVENDGLAPVLAAPDPPGDALRLAALVGFAAGLSPEGALPS